VKIIWTFAMFSLLVLSAVAWADVVAMKDGRRWEGEVLGQTDGQLTIDAMIAGIRARLTLPRAEVASVALEPLPTDFYQPDAEIANREPGPQHAHDDVVYLRVPIQGRIGQDIYAEAIGRILAYADRYRIEYVVFEIDCRAGDIDEAMRINQLLARYDSKLTYHAIVRACSGDPMVFAVYADTLQLLPGASIGGSTAPIEGRTNSESR